MLKLDVNGKRGHYLVNLPTIKSEVTLEYLKAVTANVHLSEHHALVALLYNEKLAMVLNSSKKGASMTTSCVPVLVTINEPENDFYKNIPEGSSIIITGTVLARGIHVSPINNKLNINYIASILEGDKEVGKNAFTMQEPCYFVEFKIVPVCDITGYYGDEKTIPAEAFVYPCQELSSAAPN